jgi:hypothetical protein
MCLSVVPGYADAMLALGRLMATTTGTGRKLQSGVYSRGKRMDQVRVKYVGNDVI